VSVFLFKELTLAFNSVAFFSWSAAVECVNLSSSSLVFNVLLPTVRLRLEGHADARGTREYNLALGENRALNVKKAISVSGNIKNK
jgi:hypothetical protein